MFNNQIELDAGGSSKVTNFSMLVAMTAIRDIITVTHFYVAVDFKGNLVPK